MKKLFVNGNSVHLADVTNSVEKLEVANYKICQNPMTGEVYLTKILDPSIPPTEFVDTEIVDRWLKSFNNSSGNMGILLSGLKGAGKTVLAKKLCAKSGYPIIHYSGDVSIEAMAMFLADPLLHNCILFIDEFEKTIKQENEIIAPFLKLLDGGYNTKLIVLLTSNTDNLNDYLMNRLSRIRYRRHFTQLPDEVINNIIRHFNIDEDKIEDLLLTCTKITRLSIDILINIITEMQLFNEKASEVVKHLNIVSEMVVCDVYELIHDEWKECSPITFDPADYNDTTVYRRWKYTYRSKIDEKYKPFLNDEKPYIALHLTEEEAKYYNADQYPELEGFNLHKVKEGFILTKGNISFKLVPSKKTKLLF